MQCYYLLLHPFFKLPTAFSWGEPRKRSAFSWALPMPLESSLVKVWWLCFQQFFSTHLCPDNTSFPENPYFPEVMVGFPRCRRRETCQTGGGKGKDDNCKYPILPSIQEGKHICVWENIFIYILYF